MHGESAFARVESSHGFRRRLIYIFRFHIAEQKKARRVGVSRHRLLFVFAREDVKCGMFERVIASCFEDEGKIEDHAAIIHRMFQGIRYASKVNGNAASTPLTTTRNA